MKPTELPLVQAPPLLCSFPITEVLSLPAESCKLLPSSRASPAGPNQPCSHSQCHKGARSQATSEKLQSCIKLYSRAIACSTMKKSLWTEIGSQAVTGGWVYAISWYSFSCISQQLQKQKSVSWFSVGYGFPVADASGSRTKPVIKKCRTGKKSLVGQHQSHVFS